MELEPVRLALWHIANNCYKSHIRNEVTALKLKRSIIVSNYTDETTKIGDTIINRSV